MVMLLVPSSGKSLLAMQSSTQWGRVRGTWGLLEQANPSPVAFLFSLFAASLRGLVSYNISAHFLNFFVFSSSF